VPETRTSIASPSAASFGAVRQNAAAAPRQGRRRRPHRSHPARRRCRRPSGTARPVKRAAAAAAAATAAAARAAASAGAAPNIHGQCNNIHEQCNNTHNKATKIMPIFTTMQQKKMYTSLYTFLNTLNIFDFGIIENNISKNAHTKKQYKQGHINTQCYKQYKTI
jgi:hypothetical protein